MRDESQARVVDVARPLKVLSNSNVTGEKRDSVSDDQADQPNNNTFLLQMKKSNQTKSHPTIRKHITTPHTTSTPPFHTHTHF